MVTLTASSGADLKAKLKVIDISVPLRSEGLTTEHRERSSICRFLATYAEASLLGYPLRLEKRERPDFLLAIPSGRIGIEATEAVPPNWAWADDRREKINYENPIFLKRFRPGEARRPAGEIDTIACGADRGDVWDADAPEREWAEVMTYFSLQKAEKFFQPGFKHFEANWLLVYDNWPLPLVEEPTAANYFSQQLAALSRPLPFDRIFIERNRSILQFRAATHTAQPTRDLWNDT